MPDTPNSLTIIVALGVLSLVAGIVVMMLRRRQPAGNRTPAQEWARSLVLGTIIAFGYAKLANLI
ncbi:MAG: hypothetical protein H7210_07880 [Pyrinomonadaceae bacterium]|nr:hypothetical protein [Phycisphaerales bacterium]